jgi:hypothetical protein
MEYQTSQRVDKPERWALEFWLVVIMLGVLCILVSLVLFWPIRVDPQVQGRETTFKDVLEYRSSILSIIITAFGAWVGAGAAYFFGRENLRVAAEGLLAMREVSPSERLRRTPIKQIPPSPLDWTVQRNTLFEEVKKKLMDEPARWFIPVTKSDGTLETVVNEEAVWRLLADPANAPAAGDTLEKVFSHIASNPNLKRFSDIHVTVPMDATVGTANEMMQSKGAFLAIVTSQGKPTHFFTTSEIRKLLMQST